MTEFDVGLAWLANRCHPQLATIWTDHHMVALERQIWLTVLRHQIEHGLHPGGHLIWHQYARAATPINLERIRARERVTRHDLKARIEEFNHQADPSGKLERIHWGMTSADIVDNVTLIRIRQSVETLAEIHGLPSLAAPLASLPFRGIQGAVGTQQDMIDLYGLGSAAPVGDLNHRLSRQFGFGGRVAGSVGQTYPRSWELSALAPLASVSRPGIGCGYYQMIAACAGDQWLEGDVSSSVTRRVALPGLIMATDLALCAERKRVFDGDASEEDCAGSGGRPARR